jgi:hypothetical protein
MLLLYDPNKELQGVSLSPWPEVEEELEVNEPYREEAAYRLSLRL